MPSDIRRNEGTSSSNEASFNDWVTHYNDQMIVAPNGRLHIQPFENHITPRHQDQNNASNLGEAVSQPLQQLSVHPAHTNPVPNERNVSAPRGPVPVLASYENRVQVSGPTFSWVPTSNHFDPLQNELDRMRKEIGNIMIIHEQKVGASIYPFYLLASFYHLPACLYPSPPKFAEAAAEIRM